MKHRVHELAAEFGVSSKVVVAMLADIGEYVKGPSSAVEGPVVRKLRDAFPAAAKSADIAVKPTPIHDVPCHVQPVAAEPRPATPFLPPPRQRRQGPRREWHRGNPPSDLQRVFLDIVIVPRRRDLASQPGGTGFYADEVAEARAFENEWSEAIFYMTLERIRGWMSLLPNASMRHALQFHEAGMGAYHANLRLWYGRVASDRPKLYDQVNSGRLTIAEAKKWVAIYERGIGEAGAVSR